MGVITPKIILASPSTSTIHYLFPSGDTRTGLYLAADGSSSPAVSQYGSIASPPGTTESRVKRNHSIADRGRKRQSIVVLEYEGYREVPGIKNTRCLTSEGKKHLTSAMLTAGKVSLPEASATATGVKKSTISKPISSPADDARDYSTGYFDVGPDSRNMGQRRHHRGQADLGPQDRGRVAGEKSREEVCSVLKETGDRRETNGWEPGNSSASTLPQAKSAGRPHHRGGEAKSHVPPIKVIKQDRRRSQSLSSPRPAPIPPVDPALSPLLPAPDFGDPLSLSEVLPSPSFSHLEYSAAGSDALNSVGAAKGCSKRASVVFPISAAMSRGATRDGLGGYDAGKIKAREDAEKRLNNGPSGRLAGIRRSVSLRKKNEGEVLRTRPRSQSVGARSIPPLDLPPPMPLHLQAPSNGIAGPVRPSSAFIGGLSIDLGSRYAGVLLPSDTSRISDSSPQSSSSSFFPTNTPSSDGEVARTTPVIRIIGRPLHPALHESDLSLLASSTESLGVSPLDSALSLPASLKIEARDPIPLQSRAASILSPVTPPIPALVTPPAPPHIERPLVANSPNATTSDTGRLPQRSMLLAQNSFFVPPAHPRPLMSLGKKPTLRTSKSLDPGAMKQAYTLSSPGIPEDTPPCGDHGLATQTQASMRKKLGKAASIRSTTRRISRMLESDDSKGHPVGLERGGVATTPSMRFSRRPLSTFSICSPPDAIEPLHDVSPGVGNHQGTRKTTPQYKSPVEPPSTSCLSPAEELPLPRPYSTFRSERSSPLMSASQSLRGIFGKKGFVARSLSQAFERDPMDRSQSRSEVPDCRTDLKARISSLLEATRAGSLSPESKAHRDARDRGRTADKTWRESVLQEALPVGMLSSTGKLGDPVIDNHDETHPKMGSSGSRLRLGMANGIYPGPSDRRSLASETGPDWSGVGAHMLREDMLDDWRIPSRVIGQVGKEESMTSAPSMYSNGASTYVERPTRRLGVGFPSSFSIADLKIRSSSLQRVEPVPEVPKHMVKVGTMGIRSRLISPPMPISSPLGGAARQTMESDAKGLLPSPLPREGSDLTNATTSGRLEAAIDFGFVSSFGRPKELPQTTFGRPIANPMSETLPAMVSGKRTPSSFGLSIRASLRSRSRNRQASGAGISSAQIVGSSGGNLPSHQIEPVPPLSKAFTAYDGGSVVNASAEPGNLPNQLDETEKVRKVLEWRDEVGENEGIARLEEKMRGFVVGERERIRGIGERRSGELDRSVG
ncbi:hypothetical protein IAU60_003857 [Kwoniella sp. DSM 27419]